MLEWLMEKYVAHRGLHNNIISENTLESFQNAIDNGYNIELDVQPTLDNKLIVYHDIHLGRLTNRNDYVKNLTCEQVLKTEYNGTSAHIPLFSEVLKLCEGKTGLMIEVKKDSYSCKEILVEKLLLPFLLNYKGDFVIKSFNPYTVKWFIDNAPQFKIGFLSENKSIDDYDEPCKKLVNEFLFTGKRKVDFFDYMYSLVGSELWNSVHGKMPCLCWVVKNRDIQDKLKGKAENIIFEGYNPKLIGD